MRKILAILGAIGIVGSSASMVVSCNDVADFGAYVDKIQNNLETEKANFDDGVYKDMHIYFDVIGKFHPTGNAKDEKIDSVKGTNDGTEEFISIERLTEAITQAVGSVVSDAVKDKDYTYAIYTIEDGSKAKDITADADITSLKTDDKIEISFSAIKNSDLWQGSGKFDFSVKLEGGTD